MPQISDFQTVSVNPWVEQESLNRPKPTFLERNTKFLGLNEFIYVKYLEH